MDNNKANKFKEELSNLLAKYNVRIAFTCSESSDTHGLHNDTLVIIDRTTGNEIFNAEGWTITSNSLKE